MKYIVPQTAKACAAKTDMKAGIDIKAMRFAEITLTKSHEFENQSNMKWMFPSVLKKNILQFFYVAIPPGSDDLINDIFECKIAVFNRDGWYLCVRTEDLATVTSTQSK